MKNSLDEGTLQERVDSLITELSVRAHALRVNRYRSARDSARWDARGGYKALVWVIRCLKEMRWQNGDDGLLLLVLQDYLDCLQTSAADAHEEYLTCQRRQKRGKKRVRANIDGRKIEQWRASGEEHMLSVICCKLSRIVEVSASTIATNQTLILLEMMPNNARSRFYADLVKQHFSGVSVRVDTSLFQRDLVGDE
jgi:hypothetical protein